MLRTFFFRPAASCIVVVVTGWFRRRVVIAIKAGSRRLSPHVATTLTAFGPEPALEGHT